MTSPAFTPALLAFELSRTVVTSTPSFVPKYSDELRRQLVDRDAELTAGAANRGSRSSAETQSRFSTIGGATFGAGIANEKSPEPSQNLNDSPARGCTFSVTRWPSRVTAACTDRPADGLLHEPRELPRAAHALAVELDDDVAGLEAGLLRRAVGLDLFDRRRRRGLPGLQLVLVEVADRHADLAPPRTDLTRPAPPAASLARCRCVIPVPASGTAPDTNAPAPARRQARPQSRTPQSNSVMLLFSYARLLSQSNTRLRSQTHASRKGCAGGVPRGGQCLSATGTTSDNGCENIGVLRGKAGTRIDVGCRSRGINGVR